MYNIAFQKQTNIKFNSCTISNSKGTKAVIHPMRGASLQQLYFKNKTIINNIINKEGNESYLNSSCSAILFPFANRIKDGKYSYKNNSYQLACNETSRGHAMHGLVYKNTFNIVNLTNTEDSASVSYCYKEIGTSKGFPFPYEITLTYILNDNCLKLYIEIKNIGIRSFPFSLGWHPYFYSKNLNQSELYMDSSTKIIADDRMIPIKTINSIFPNPLNLSNQEFDDGFILNQPTIGYKTPEYKINIKTELENARQYVQLYIPSHRQSIAIEPMTAAADCYNNGLGTKELQPGEHYKVSWVIEEVF
ncbi:MAG: aldose 1-epimerase [Saprospiraceae bacterium]|nr:aldose 1-epimerase [Saprospiraceae bacterium]